MAMNHVFLSFFSNFCRARIHIHYTIYMNISTYCIFFGPLYDEHMKCGEIQTIPHTVSSYNVIEKHDDVYDCVGGRATPPHHLNANNFNVLNFIFYYMGLVLMF